uniref:Uncharacterized protein n=1 Tax=Salmonella enterica subsp. salamae TaxID=59202 RepID=I3W451_SALER|nr:hypothetical protein [Salmonella enterica subsp. salamae]
MVILKAEAAREEARKQLEQVTGEKKIATVMKKVDYRY